MNEDRLIKIIEDMAEVIENLKGCKISLEKSDNKTAIYLEFGLKQIFVDFFITVENFTSIMLKELKKFKIGLDMKQSLAILLEEEIMDKELHDFLNSARLIRNRVSHRYKEPTREELVGFIDDNIELFSKMLEKVKSYI